MRAALVCITAICTAGEPSLMLWTVKGGKVELVALLPIPELEDAP